MNRSRQIFYALAIGDLLRKIDVEARGQLRNEASRPYRLPYHRNHLAEVELAQQSPGHQHVLKTGTTRVLLNFFT